MVMGQQGFLGFMFKTEWNDEVVVKFSATGDRTSL